MAGQRQSPGQPPVEEFSAVHVHGRGDDQPEFVDQAGLEEGLGEGDAPVHPDVISGPLLQFSDEFGQAAIDDPDVRWWSSSGRPSLV